jgi:branched-chain amino acid aminotransferase
MSIHRYFLHNGKVRQTSEASLFPGQLGLLAGWGIFTTLRVVDGAIFAWERHWARLQRDAQLLNVELPGDPAHVELDLARLIEANHAPNCTMRYVVVRNGGGMWEGPAAASGSGLASDTIALTADSKLWGASVRLGIQPHARYAASDFTRAKIISWAHNLRWLEMAQRDGFDEVILLNEFDRVAECTSANVFAVFGSSVTTPPLGEGCLPGITREVLLDGVDLDGIHFSERPLAIDDLYQADEVFVTSTTRGLLPVAEIAGRPLQRRGDKINRMISAFDDFVKSDIARRKRAPVSA